MARVTVEDCLEEVENRFVLIMIATRRARALRKGGQRIFDSGNKEIVQALREVAAGFVDLDEKSRERLREQLGGELE
jgi:DNA-directed RNA polymerase subunit omega